VIRTCPADPFPADSVAARCPAARRRPLRATLAATALLAASALVAGSALADTTAEPAAGDAPRVAVLIPFVADALGECGDRVDVVASVRRSLHEQLPDGLVDLGNPHSPSFERLAEARPDQVIGDRTIHAMLEEKLSLGGRAEVMLIDTTGVEPTLDALREVAERVGAAAALTPRVDAVAEAIDAAHVDDGPTVLALFGTPSAFYAVTERHWLGDLLGRLGLANVAAGLSDSKRFPGLVALNDEMLAGLRPELVLLVSHGDPTRIRASLEQRIQAGGVWSHLGESATRGVHVLDPRLFSSNPGLDLAEAARALATLAGSETVARASGEAGAPPGRRPEPLAP